MAHGKEIFGFLQEDQVPINDMH